jgi:hypothetical protein
MFQPAQTTPRSILQISSSVITSQHDVITLTGEPAQGCHHGTVFTVSPFREVAWPP